MKKTLILTLFSFFAVACMKKATVNTKLEANIAIAKQLFDHFNQHEWEKMANLYVESAEFKDPSLGTDIVKQTRQQTMEKYKELSGIFPNIKDDIVNIYPSGEQNVIVEFISSGTAPDGSKLHLPICSILTIENGLITKDFTYYDNSDSQ